MSRSSRHHPPGNLSFNLPYPNLSLSSDTPRVVKKVRLSLEDQLSWIFSNKSNADLSLDCSKCKNELSTWKRLHSEKIRAVTTIDEAKVIIREFMEDLLDSNDLYPSLHNLPVEKQRQYAQKLLLTLKNYMKKNKANGGKENIGKVVIFLKL